MYSLSWGAERVKKRAPIKRYLVPGIPAHERQRVAGFGYFDTGIWRSERTGSGRYYDGDTINILESILDEVEADGLDTIQVVIVHKSRAVTYQTDIDTLRQHGQRVLADGWQIALPRCFWSVDGQPPAGPQPEPKEPQAVQPTLFDLALGERRKAVYF
jgi:hypothetical protein